MSLKFVKDSIKFFNASGRALKAAHREFFNPSKIEEFPKHSGGGYKRKSLKRRNNRLKRRNSKKKVSSKKKSVKKKGYVRN